MSVFEFNRSADTLLENRDYSRTNPIRCEYVIIDDRYGGSDRHDCEQQKKNEQTGATRLRFPVRKHAGRVHETIVRLE